ncbi:MAG: DUF116 domain-containing protein [Planctomycetota bacterium]
MFDSLIVKVYNRATRFRKVRVRPENLLLLLPHCLQRQNCPHNLLAAVENCERCGRCKMKDLLELAERFGIPCAVVSGGRQAELCVKNPAVQAVLAVACEKELSQGMRAVFPKPGIGVVNLRPHGPCVDTDVDLALVESAIREFLIDGSASGTYNPPA